jgi:response regulator RpfG family c-di-GMP phosphodiesterase
VSFLRHHKTYLVLIAGQAICLAFGLWAQQRFVAAHQRWQTSQRQAAIDNAERSAASQSAANTAQEVFEQRAVQVLGYIWILGLQAIVAWLVISRMRSSQERKQSQSQEEALLKAKELLLTRDAIVFGLAKLAESRDPETGMHLERISLYSTRLAAACRKHRRYRAVVNNNFINTIGISSALHDIGKVGVEDAVLLKPGLLTDHERQRIQRHAQLGGDCIQQIERRLGHSNFLQMAREIVLYHHERWNGTGYPHGLAGEDIPLAARIVAIADVYDALRVKRVYKAAKPHEECVAIIKGDAGKHFDPHLVDVFLSIEHQFREIAERFAEEDPDILGSTEHGPAARMSEKQALILAETIDAAVAENRVGTERRQLVEVG